MESCLQKSRVLFLVNRELNNNKDSKLFPLILIAS